MNAEIAELISQLPEGGRLAPDDARPSRAALAKLFALGPKATPEIVALLKPPEEGGDARVRLALHNLATLAAAADDKQRAAFCQSLATTLEDDHPAEIKTFIIAQLQLCGGPEVSTALAELLSDEHQAEPAAQALLAIRSGAAEAFRHALPKATGRMRLVMVQNLGVLQDEAALPLVRPLVTSDDPELRLAAAYTLGRVGNSGTDINSLLALARREQDFTQAQAIDACFDLAERLGTLDKRVEQRQLLSELEALGKGNYVSAAAARLLAEAS